MENVAEDRWNQASERKKAVKSSENVQNVAEGTRVKELKQHKK